MERDRKMDNDNNQPLVQPNQNPGIPPFDPQMVQPFQPQPVQQVQQPVQQVQQAQPVQQPIQQLVQQVQQPVQQPVYQQPAYQQTYPQQYQQAQNQYAGNNAPLGVQPADMYTPEEQAKRRKQANILCFISLACQVAPEILTGVFSGLVESLGDISNVTEPITYGYSLITGGTYIASWVLMIIARVKYKESKFAKILMWVYIGLLAAGVITLILVIAMCAYMLKDCQGF